ncbi:hypothetical protein P389DRAFT_96756 [Cystobasidium minutum MCA 4210]|uniref:uncharacterized protein n=1 Tax=Cystobasidium minutum MCA 4210 TaxID=1397322 RepID=UPI0034CF2928|eukprot:jgi/Rhomi1/96756/CE96755_7557
MASEEAAVHNEPDKKLTKDVASTEPISLSSSSNSGDKSEEASTTAAPPTRQEDDNDISSSENSKTVPTSSEADGSGRTTPTAASLTAQPPSAALAAPAAATPQQQQQHQSNDAVSALQAMFPGMDATIISEVLAAHGGDADAASMALLELNNPDATAQPAAPAPGAGATDNGDARARTAAAQMKADEEYARQLMAQMEREHQQEYGRPLGSAPSQHQQQRQADSTVNYDQLNYVPRQRNRHGQVAGTGSGSASPSLQQQQQYHDGQQHGGEGQQGALGQWLGGQTGPDGRWKHQDELDQLAEQFNKFADTGKKTFNSFLSKAKDKYAQTAQQRALYAQSSHQQQGANEASSSGFKLGGLKLPNIPSPWQGGTGFRPGEKPMSPEREELRGGPYSDSRSSVMRDYSSSPSRPSPSSNNRNSFDDDAPPIQINKPLPTSGSTQSQAIRTASSTQAPTLSSSPATTTPGFSTSPPHLAQQNSRSSFSSGSPAKVHMLPRQTINLLDQSGDKDRRSTSPAVAGAGSATAGPAAGTTTSLNVNRRDRDYDDDDSDSDVEYVRNPFNDDD